MVWLQSSATVLLTADAQTVAHYQVSVVHAQIETNRAGGASSSPPSFHTSGMPLPICFAICLFISPDLDGHRAPKNSPLFRVSHDIVSVTRSAPSRIVGSKKWTHIPYIDRRYKSNQFLGSRTEKVGRPAVLGGSQALRNTTTQGTFIRERQDLVAQADRG